MSSRAAASGVSLMGEFEKPSMGSEHEGAYCTEVGAEARCPGSSIGWIVERDCGGFRVRQTRKQGQMASRASNNVTDVAKRPEVGGSIIRLSCGSRDEVDVPKLEGSG